MASYYYLMSSLPMLRTDGDLPFSYAKFLELCRGNAGESAMRRLEELSLGDADGPLLSEWAPFYRSFQKELSYQRNMRLGKPAQMPTDRDERAVKAVAAAMDEKNPLIAERAMLAVQFAVLDELCALHNFDEYSLMGYAIKLKLLERQASFDQKKGKAEFNAINERLQQQVKSIG